MAVKPLLILTAMTSELRVIARALKLRPGADGTYAGVADDGTPILATTCGIRARRLRPELLASVSKVIVAGVAGGLDPAVQTGDVVGEEGIHTSTAPVCTVAAKAQLFRERGAACVDMETEIVRRAARSAGVPFTAVRVVLDACDRPLPPYLFDLIDDRGRPKPFRVVALLLCRPRAWLELVGLARVSRRALGALGEAVRVRVNV